MDDRFYAPGWMREAAEERWARERETEIRRAEQDMADEIRKAEEAASFSGLSPGVRHPTGLFFSFS